MSFSEARHEQDAHMYRLTQARRMVQENPTRARLSLAAAARAADRLANRSAGSDASEAEVSRARELAATYLVAVAHAWESMLQDIEQSTYATSLGPLLAWIGCSRSEYDAAVDAAMERFGGSAA